MKLTVLEEPPLEFHDGGRHIDPRHGIGNYGPADLASEALRSIRVGIVGTRAAIDGLKGWLEHCREPIEPKSSRLGRLFVPFPGFNPEATFRSQLVWDPRLERELRTRDLDRLKELAPHEATQAAVELYAHELDLLDEEPHCDVILIARPDELIERGNLGADPDTPWKRAAAPDRAEDFRAALKARSMHYKRPIQIIRRTTWDPNYKPASAERVRIQDEATRAWNLHTALYYKAGGVPWRLPRNSTDLTSCFVGVTFYRNGDNTTLETSVAQIFNQRGDGVIVRGAPARISGDDRKPHLTREAARVLLKDALLRYRDEHHNLPARVVLHKTSSYTDDEIAGFHAAAEVFQIYVVELLWLPTSDPIRLFRPAYHPPLRGTLLSLDNNRHTLYTRGSVPFYGTYPGMYVPQAISFRVVEAESSPIQLAVELLALTKMNWNQTQLDGRRPITLNTAEQVSGILRHLDSKTRPQGRYAYYM
jgi:hypothetical protein